MVNRLACKKTRKRSGEQPVVAQPWREWGRTEGQEDPRGGAVVLHLGEVGIALVIRPQAEQRASKRHCGRRAGSSGDTRKPAKARGPTASGAKTGAWVRPRPNESGNGGNRASRLSQMAKET